MNGFQRLEEKASKLFNLSITKTDGLSPNQFHGVPMNDIPTVEDLLTINILLYDIDIMDGNITGELRRRSVEKYEKTVRMLRYNNYLCFVSNNNAVFQAFRGPNCDIFFSRAFNLERDLTTCRERVTNVYPRNVFQIREALFEKSDSFSIKYTSEEKTLQKFSSIRI